MKRASLSIGMRLALWYLVIFLLAEMVFGAGMWFILRKNLDDIADATLEGQAADLQRFLEARKNDSAQQLEQEIGEDYNLDRSEDYVQITDSDGAIIYRSRFLEANPLPEITPDHLRRPRSRTVDLGDEPFRILSEQIDVEGRTFIIQIGGKLTEEVETLDAFRKYLWLSAPVLLLAASAVGYLLSRRALAPVDALTRTAHNISGRNLSSRIETLHTGDELQRLSDTLNEMLARIETAFLRITEFTADASHELRTPIALIHTEAELALRKSRNEEEYREALHHILLASERTSKLIDELLALARTDSGVESLDFRSVDVLKILRDAEAKWKPIATVRNLHFISPGSQSFDLFVTGDESALRRVVDILLDNAFKYTQSGSVTLSLEQKNGSALVGVADTGMGIAANDQKRIFERFYRVDKARSRELGGAGLGLAIAQWIVERHHGSILVTSELGQGSKFIVALQSPTEKANSSAASI